MNVAKHPNEIQCNGKKIFEKRLGKNRQCYVI